jgi:hypothetical protein
MAYERPDREHRARSGEIVSRHVDGNGLGEFFYAHRKPSAADTAARHERELREFHQRHQVWRELNRRHKRERRELSQRRGKG